MRALASTATIGPARADTVTPVTMPLDTESIAALGDRIEVDLRPRRSDPCTVDYTTARDPLAVVALGRLDCGENPVGLVGTHLARGGLALVPPGTPSHWRCPGGHPDVLVVRIGPIVMEQLASGEDTRGSLVARWNVLDAPVMETARALLDAHRGDEPGRRLLVESRSLLLGGLLLQALCAKPPRPSAGARLGARRLARVEAYVEAHLEEDFGVADLAACAALSPGHFARAFKATVGLTPHGYVLGARVARAKRLLAETDEPIAQVAAACGFSSQSHLTTVFAAHAGATPAAYRRARR